ncbi:MAG: biotin--[acetyl-CoA-carboxylase] ligase [Clostridia bacterium]|nr:biotin--[acetyl-CoA-carboxylase] ligase [Clostridia bacterium]MDD4048101.1 biotin--[acetyl-CoA-carboxylase] ligase [Clostridia bacterium]
MKNSILRMLMNKEGDYISGEKISNDLSVSRTAIWKHINTLKKEGYNIISLPRKGYCIEKRSDIISSVEIGTGLETKVVGQNLFCFSSVDSTNKVAKNEAAKGCQEGTVVVADKQDEGKGRLNRNWVSPSGRGLWFSIVLRPDIDPPRASQLTFVSAVAVCRSLQTLTGLELNIKWPNDILFKGKKVCGILTELSAEIDKVNYVVVGIGININHTIDDFPLELRDTATSLTQISGQNYNRPALLRSILLEYEKQYFDYQEKGFMQILDSWRKLNTTLGKKVKVNTREESYYGVAEDINEEGCLIVRKESGEVVELMAGDVSLRGTLDD